MNHVATDNARCRFRVENSPLKATRCETVRLLQPRLYLGSRRLLTVSLPVSRDLGLKSGGRWKEFVYF
ncbi:hypothetical protein RRG08_028127 [Elysia crispata]|uniref:Uncharacterized protein n=1 Tax=Elysia crispata TaxID=231223 RepID=A0AAE1A3Q5_9GAST|nr:hypothetical protein RRG08_028127 [Elysia crispata]